MRYGLDSLVPGSTSGSGNDTSTTPSDWQRFAPRSQVSAGLTLDPAQDYLASPWPSPTGQPPSRSSMRSSGGWTGFKQRRRSCASPMLRLCTRAWRTTDAARDGSRSTWPQRGHWGRFQSSSSWDYRSGGLAVGCSFPGDNRPRRNSTRRPLPASNSAVESNSLSPTRARRLTWAFSSLSCQRSPRTPPASLGVRVCRRELRSASCANTSAS
jgi:hypothetical protein